MKKFGRAVVASIVAGTLIATPVFASDIDTIRANKNQAQSVVNSLQKELETALGQISQLEDDMLVKKDQIEQANTDLEAAREKEQKQYEAMKKRIRYMYEDGGTSAIEKIFTCGSISEMLNQAEYVQKLHSYDREMLAEFVKTKNDIADLKAQLEQDEKDMENLHADLSAKNQQLSATIESKREEVANLDEQLQQAIIAEQKRKEEEARRREEERRKAEEEKKQQEAANKPNNNNNNNNSNNKPNNNNNSNNKPDNTAPPANNNNNNNTNNNTNNTQPETPSKPPVEEPSGNKNAAAIIVSAAYSQLGVPYEWGGTTPGVGLDCSGLTSYCHRQAGISIPRTSSGQLAAGRRVSNPQPGDICWTPGHVAIYIGGGKMIEAPDIGQVVKISSVRASVYLRFW